MADPTASFTDGHLRGGRALAVPAAHHCSGLLPPARHCKPRYQGTPAAWFSRRRYHASVGTGSLSSFLFLAAAGQRAAGREHAAAHQALRLWVLQRRGLGVGLQNGVRHARVHGSRGPEQRRVRRQVRRHLVRLRSLHAPHRACSFDLATEFLRVMTDASSRAHPLCALQVLRSDALRHADC